MKLRVHHLLPPDDARLMVAGSFSRPKAQQVLILNGPSVLTLYELSPRSGSLLSLFWSNLFTHVRQLQTIRPPGSRIDYILISSDSGALTILTADSSTRSFSVVHSEVYGKSGCRRAVPAQYLTCDPRGRAVVLAALEKAKIAYVLNRDAAALHPTVSSPLDFQRPNVMTHDLTGLDVGFENPMFAALEQVFNTSSKLLVWYELDLGLNQLVRRRQQVVDSNPYILIPVPGFKDGPGGVLLVSENSLSYYDYSKAASQDLSPNDDSNLADSKRHSAAVISCQIPILEGRSKHEPALIVSHATFVRKKSNTFLVLLCTEDGDLLKADLKWDHNLDLIMTIGYFDHIPASAQSMLILKSGFLCAGIEGTGLSLFKIKDTEIPLFNTAATPGLKSNGSANGNAKSPLDHFTRDGVARMVVTMIPNNRAVTTTGAVLRQFYDGDGVLLLGTGRGAEGRLRAVRRGMSVSITSQGGNLPVAVGNMFSLSETEPGRLDQFVLITNRVSSKVLHVGSSAVQEASHFQFETEKQTLWAASVAPDTFVQVTSEVVKMTNLSMNEVRDWKPPQPGQVQAANSSGADLIVITSSGTLFYLRLDGRRLTIEEEDSFEEFSVVSKTTSFHRCVSVQHHFNVTQGIRFIVVSTDHRVRLFRVDARKRINALGVFLAPSKVTDILLTTLGSDSGVASVPLIFCCTESGHLSCLELDENAGTMSLRKDLKSGVRVFGVRHLRTQNTSVALLLATNPTLVARFGSVVTFLRLGYLQFTQASSFVSRAEELGLVALVENKVTLMSIPCSSDLQRLALHDDTSRTCLSPSALFNCEFQERTHSVDGTVCQMIPIMPSGQSNKKVKEAIEGHNRCAYVLASVEGGLKSGNREAEHARLLLIRLQLQPESPTASTFETSDTVEIQAHRFLFTVLEGVEGTPTEANNRTVVLSQQGTGSNGRRFGSNSSKLTVYRIESGQLNYLHSTELEGNVHALTPFREYVLVGAGSSLRYYQVGSKKLLLRGEYRNAVMNRITALCVAGGERIFVGDLMQSVTVLHFEPSPRNGEQALEHGKLRIVATDTIPRWINTLTLLDFHTVCGSDKFGNVFVLRLSRESGSQLRDPHKKLQLNTEASFYAGSAVLHIGNPAFSGTTMKEHGSRDSSSEPEVMHMNTPLTLTCSNGSVAYLGPFNSSAEQSFCEKVHKAMQELSETLGGRSRPIVSPFYFSKHVTDLDFCEAFASQPPKVKSRISEKINLPIQSVERKLGTICAQFRVI